ncbi:DUF4258 domain-containing protein [Dyadobacter sp. CY345]|uniref:DUF4258 domain-containing protein n=1 Tax=Dyadobacter sp. CY345 TaxID=2909335 RepID=UPI001F3D0462|nr:DUF4258 domain-containing protein [Dyadobacter sp. CY345]MCF2444505.1 DUF4258 domain-containing protein [Dyadobacter sp. CY345]
MPKFILSKHAAEQIQIRGISQNIVQDVVSYPQKVEELEDGQFIYQKTVVFPDGFDYLVRVFVNSNKIPNLIKTVYRTTKFSKYE